MTRESLAKEVNARHNIFRQIAVDSKIDLKEGDIYDNRGKIESWAISSPYADFNIENDNKIVYVFNCKNVPCHEVNYDNEEEVEVLNACDGEMEVLVLPSQKMRIVSVYSDEDYEEIGYYEVELEIVE